MEFDFAFTVNCGQGALPTLSYLDITWRYLLTVTFGTDALSMRQIFSFVDPMRSVGETKLDAHNRETPKRSSVGRNSAGQSFEFGSARYEVMQTVLRRK